jgi:hypothetical protein
VAGTFTSEQRRENSRFVEILGRTGNARLAAREIGRKPSTMHHRRRVCAAFAQNWAAAVAAAHARFHLAGGRRGPESGTEKAGASAPAAQPGSGSRTAGGEAVVVRSQNGRLQMRFAHPGKLTRTTEQVFLASLAATANVRLSAAAAGASPAAFYRRRQRNRAFEEEFRIALRTGYDRLEIAAIERTLATIGGEWIGEWHEAALGNALPPMSWDQAFQALCLHRNTVRLGLEAPRKPYGGEEDFVKSHFALERTIEAFERRAAYEDAGNWRLATEPAPTPLPPLDLVTGWSRASGRAPHHEGRALFGGWRIADMKRKIG